MTLMDHCPVLREIYSSMTVRDEAGTAHALENYLLPHFADALYRTVLKQCPTLVVEVGLANACSSLAILTALEELGGERRLVSIDPFQSTQYRNCGLVAIDRAGLGARHSHIEAPDYLALPGLLESGGRVDVAYIDGNHRMEYVLLDFWYLDQMVPTGGLIAFNDCHLPGVHAVVKFLLSYRRYTERDVGLRPSYVDYSRARGLIRRLTHASPQTYYRNASDRYFEKEEEFRPAWDFYVPF